MAEKSLKMYHEKPVQIIVNGRATLTLMAHAENLEHLVVGALITERVIESVSDIESILADGTQVSVVTRNPYAILLSRKTVLAGCGGASSFLDSGKLGRVVPLSLSEDIIEYAISAVQESAWFSAGLFSSSGVLISLAEDISSQNAVDELIGEALQKGVNPAECFVVLRGNCVVETMRKIIIAKIPMLAVSGAMTDAAQISADDACVRLIQF